MIAGIKGVPFSQIDNDSVISGASKTPQLMKMLKIARILKILKMLRVFKL